MTTSEYRLEVRDKRGERGKVNIISHSSVCLKAYGPRNNEYWVVFTNILELESVYAGVL